MALYGAVLLYCYSVGAGQGNSAVLPNTARFSGVLLQSVLYCNTAHNTAIQHKNLLYWAIQRRRIAPRLLYAIQQYSAIQRNTAQYSNTAIQRNTVQS